jgi:hypothetical protein
MRTNLAVYIADNLHTHIQVLPEKQKPSFWVKKDQVHDFERVKLHLNDRHFMMTDYDKPLSSAHSLYDVEPNFVIYNPVKMTHQAFWLLQIPVHCQNTKSDAYRYLRAIESAYDTKYGCDTDFQRHIHRNPLYFKSDIDWRHTNSYKLKELSEVVDLKTVISEKTKLARESAEGRNSALFDELRKWAYKQIKNLSTCDFGAFTEQITVRANHLNTFPIPLSDSELKTISRSISRFCIARIDDKESFSKKQAVRGAVGGKKSKGGGRPKINERLLAEIHTLQKVHKYSKSKIAKELSISRATVIKYALF